MKNGILNKAKDLGLYVLQGAIPSFEMYRDEATGFTLHWSEGISHSVVAWGDLLATSRQRLFLTTLPWYCNGGFEKQAKLVTALSDDLSVWDPRENFLILCNAQDEVEFARSSGFKNAILCNHNSLLDWNTYTLDPDRNEFARPYDLVINCRPENWKRPFFAERVEHLAVIKGLNYRPGDYFELESLRPDYINPQRLPLEEVVNILNQSRVGGIFSSEEGGCYSSSEYLLCGLPVVSTPSRGGRDVWFDSDNSIIINPDGNDTAKKVAEAVKILAQRCDSNPSLRTIIRKSHIEKAIAMRKLLFREVESLCSKAGVNLNFKDIFENQYRNKMTRYIKIGDSV